MFKIIAILLIAVGIYIGVTYNEEITDIVETDAFEQVQDKLEELGDSDAFEQLKDSIAEGKDKLVDTIDEIKD